jgi:hypothetical protein
MGQEDWGKLARYVLACSLHGVSSHGSSLSGPGAGRRLHGCPAALLKLLLNHTRVSANSLKYPGLLDGI